MVDWRFLPLFGTLALLWFLSDVVLSFIILKVRSMHLMLLSALKTSQIDVPFVDYVQAWVLCEVRAISPSVHLINMIDVAAPQAADRVACICAAHGVLGRAHLRCCSRRKNSAFDKHGLILGLYLRN